MPLRIGADMPELTGATDWLNGAAVRREELIGAPTLVHVWSVSCYCCKKNLPTLREWKREYGPLGLKVVAVHMPRAEDETDVAKVCAAAEEFGITEPCAVDNEHAVKDAFLNEHGFVPAYYLFDAEGKLRSRTAGDAGLRMLEGALKRLLEPKEGAQTAAAK